MSGEQARRSRQSLPLSERLWFSVQKSDGCWEWTGSCNRFGYGQIASDRRKLKTHRVSWELHNGPIPDGLQVLHKCDNPKCVRPDHLFLGTQQDNMDDMNVKGRRVATSHRGEAHPRSRLKAVDIPLIRRAVAIGFRHKDVAAAYGVGESQVAHIASGISWRHIA